MRAYGPERGFGLYVHWPYCARICPYCDFNVYAAKSRDPEPLIGALMAGLVGHRPLIPDHPPATSLYLGGGTPSLIPPALIERLVNAVRDWPGLTADAEVTLEANPNDVLNGDLQGWKAAGVNRLSIGLQSLDDEALTFLGRDHDAAAARRAINRALPVFDNCSIDLIYARPGQTMDAWRAELNDALALGAPHLSLYELTIAEGTAFASAVRRGDLAPMPDEQQAELYELTEDLVQAAGLAAYEVSNYARSGAYRGQHNLTYWRSGDWIGLGPGAHGRLTTKLGRVETLAVRRPAEFLTQVETDGLGLAEQTRLSPEDAHREALIMGLRSVEGIDPRPIEAGLGAPLNLAALEQFSELALVNRAEHRISLTARGRLLADRIAADLLVTDR